ncbi:MAG: YbjN domain-containing protein [Nitriliruptoraceae bacterium]|nr:YbjN domain-containing protein [Nitriliruptoraceae bacterium]
MTEPEPTTGHAHDRQQVTALVREVLQAAELHVTEVAPTRLMTMLSGEWKRTIPLLLDIDERTLTATSLFAGVPDEGHEAVYRLLLQRNQRSGYVHFALDDEGDLILTGKVPLAAVDATTLDELLGEVLTLADTTFNRVLRTGFASYLDHEQRWREGAGLPANPVGEAIHER